jgi:hypothetical protein
MEVAMWNFLPTWSTTKCQINIMAAFVEMQLDRRFEWEIGGVPTPTASHKSPSWEDSTSARDVMRTNQPMENVTWLFDLDDDKGWQAYDEESCNILEGTFQKFSNLDETMNSRKAIDPLVFLQGGKYQVNVRSMEQINVQTQFPRVVQRRSSGR